MKLPPSRSVSPSRYRFQIATWNAAAATPLANTPKLVGAPFQKSPVPAVGYATSYSFAIRSRVYDTALDSRFAALLVN